VRIVRASYFPELVGQVGVVRDAWTDPTFGPSHSAVTAVMGDAEPLDLRAWVTLPPECFDIVPTHPPADRSTSPDPALCPYMVGADGVWLERCTLPRYPEHVGGHVTEPIPAPPPEESFRATELAKMRERPTRPEVARPDEGDEREVMHLGREQLRELARERTKERDAARGAYLELAYEIEEVRVRLRRATGLLSDVDRLSEQVSTFLDAEVKR
jgi:hypothetical protein